MDNRVILLLRFQFGSDFYFELRLLLFSRDIAWPFEIIKFPDKIYILFLSKLCFLSFLEIDGWAIMWVENILYYNCFVNLHLFCDSSVVII